MTPEEAKSEKDFAKAMAAACVRRGELEQFHSGVAPTTLTGDYSDVFVVDAAGRRIPWTEVSRIDQNEMRTLMIGVVNRIYTFLVRTIFAGMTDAIFIKAIERAALPWTQGWDEPAYLENFLMPSASIDNRDTGKF